MTALNLSKKQEVQRWSDVRGVTENSHSEKRLIAVEEGCVLDSWRQSWQKSEYMYNSYPFFMSIKYRDLL